MCHKKRQDRRAYGRGILRAARQHSAREKHAATAQEPGGIPETISGRVPGRDLIAAMVYSFAHINAVLEMKARDYFVQDRREYKESSRLQHCSMAVGPLLSPDSASTQ